MLVFFAITPLLVFFTNNLFRKQTTISMKLNKFNHNKELPQFYYAIVGVFHQQSIHEANNYIHEAQKV